jgi:hypothetical protein
MSDPDGRRRASRGPDWLRATDGVFMIGLGVFALLNASGRLPWSFWYDALSLWPILLVSGGVRIAVGRSRWPWLALLGPLVVLATLAGLASGRIESRPGTWQPVSVTRPADVQKMKLRSSLAASRLEVATRPLAEGLLLEGRQGSKENKARVATKAEEGIAKVALSLDKMTWSSYVVGRLSRWELGLTNELPLVIDVEGAMIGSRFDLTQAQLETATFRGAWISADLRLPRPKTPTRIEVHGVFNSLDLAVPPGTPVRVHGTRFPFNMVDPGAGGGDPTDAANPGYEIRLYGIYSRVGVTDGQAR